MTGSRASFDAVAELYDRARPGYPEQLFDDLFNIGGLKSGSAVLEIGCGTGQASRPLAQRGCELACLDLGEQMAQIARRNLKSFQNVEVINAPFETWERPGASFDAVFAATSWHWLVPSIRYVKAARHLKPHGILAIVTGGHVFPPDFDPFFEEIQACYESLGQACGQWPPPLPEDAADLRQEIAACGLFEVLAVNCSHG